MKKKLTNNLLLKIVSIFIAVLVWFIVVNINDPIVSIAYNVPVVITNSAYVESIGKTYRVAEEGQDLKVRVVLRGNKSVVENRPVTDIQAVADLTQIVDMEAEPYVMVPITVTCEGVLPENITITPQNIRIVLEDVASEEFVIGFDVNGVPSNEYRVGEVTAKPEKVRVIGPTSVIQKIDQVVASVNVAGLSEDTMSTSKLEVYDKNHEVLTEAAMSYLKFDIGDPVVAVNVDLWKVVQDVEIAVSYSGTPQKGYHVSQVSSTPVKINIAGTDESLELLRERNNRIEIPASEIDVSGATSNREVKIDLTEYLPENTKIAADVTTAIVTVSVLPIGSQSFVIQTKNIEVYGLVGLDTKYAAVYEIDEVTINVSAENQILATITEETLKPWIDLTGLEVEKFHSIPLNVTLPEGGELLEQINVRVEIKELEVAKGE